MTSPHAGRAPVRAAAAVAGFVFLCALGVGTALVVGAKLQVTGLGAGAPPWSVLKAIVVVSLGALGAPVDLGGVTLQVLPLGGVVVLGLGAASATRRVFGSSRAGGTTRAAGMGLAALAGPLLAVICGVAAELSHFGADAQEIGVRAWAAAVAGGLWGTAFVLWGLFVPRRTSSWPADLRDMLRPLLWFGVPALAVVLVGGVVRLTAQSPSPAAAAGTFVHGAAFVPNLGIAVGALSLGAPVEAGVGALVEEEDTGAPVYSLLDWNGRPAPVVAWGLVLVPAVSLLAAGARIRRPRTIPRDALVFAAACGVLALLGDARVGLDAGERGFARLAPEALPTFVLGLGWALFGLTLGWLLRLWRDRRGEDDKDLSR